MGALAEWRFCPRCGTRVAASGDRAECEQCGYVAYANPAPAACALCVDEAGRVLLSRRAREPYRGMWDLPGGFVGEDEHPLDALRRELREETGLEAEPGEWFGAFLVPYGDGRTVLNLVWRARLAAGDPVPSDDVSELRWFAASELPPESELAWSEPVRLWQASGG